MIRKQDIREEKKYRKDLNTPCRAARMRIRLQRHAPRIGFFIFKECTMPGLRFSPTRDSRIARPFRRTGNSDARNLSRFPTIRPWYFAIGLAILTALLSGCDGAQSALDPRGPIADEISRLWWVLLAFASAVFVFVIGLLLYAVFRNPDRRKPLAHTPFLLIGGLVFPTVSVIALLIYGTEIGRRIVAAPDEPALQIDVTAHQWWWEVSYPAEGDLPGFTTANEIHIPTGATVLVVLRSRDVIHSFWVPNLAGKMDVIPGHENRQRIVAGLPGEYRGQCAEFCGLGHALMAFTVIAHSPEDFAAWRRTQAGDAQPESALPTAVQPGFAAFAAHGCATCHRIRGAFPDSGSGDPATGIYGPDLTRLATRATLGARTLPYGRDHVVQWILTHRTLKPGNRMPDFSHLPDEEVAAIADYLDTLR